MSDLTIWEKLMAIPLLIMVWSVAIGLVLFIACAVLTVFGVIDTDWLMRRTVVVVR